MDWFFGALIVGLAVLQASLCLNLAYYYLLASSFISCVACSWCALLSCQLGLYLSSQANCSLSQVVSGAMLGVIMFGAVFRLLRFLRDKIVPG